MRGGNEGNGYETWTPALRKRIIKVLGSIDVYEDTFSPHCLPDHKFSEIRWDDETKGENPDAMADEEIRQKFQLLTNQRNQQSEKCAGLVSKQGSADIPSVLNTIMLAPRIGTLIFLSRVNKLSMVV